MKKVIINNLQIEVYQKEDNIPDTCTTFKVQTKPIAKSVLESVFGEPTKDKLSKDKKVHYTWLIRINEKLFELHDWKSGKCDDDEPVTWSVRSEDASKTLQDEFIKTLNIFSIYKYYFN